MSIFLENGLLALNTKTLIVKRINILVMIILKHFLLAASLLVCCTSLCQAHGVSVKSGEMPQFMDGQTVNLQVDLSTTTWDESRSLKRFFYVEYRDDYFEDEIGGAFDRFVENMNKAYVEGFKEGRCQLKVVDGKADYTVIVNITNFHDTREMWDRQTDAYGEAQIINNATGEVVCVLEIDCVDGDEIRDKAKGTIDCMKNVGESISNTMFYAKRKRK